MHEKKDVEEDVLNAGASIFLMKNAPAADLVQAIRGVSALTKA